ncbi:MAG: NOP5/NOP56 family protein [Halobacteria archaeon]
MTDSWFSGSSRDEDVGELAEAMRSETTDGDIEPVEHPMRAVENGFVEDVDEYYDLLHEVSIAAAERDLEDASRHRERAIVNAVRTYESLNEAGNLMNERYDDWIEDSPEDGNPPVVVEDLENVNEEVTELREELREYVEQQVSEVAPNLASMSPGMVAARLIEKAGGLKELARMPSSTVQVLGAEDSLFNHLRSDSPPPKHGVIYLHPYVRNTSKTERGSAARLVAGKLTIAARIDYYSGEINEELSEELDQKIEEIRDRGEGN